MSDSGLIQRGRAKSNRLLDEDRDKYKLKAGTKEIASCVFYILYKEEIKPIFLSLNESHLFSFLTKRAEEFKLG